MSNKTTLSYIGLGLMGLPMAKHLLSLGYSIHGYDLNPEALKQAKKLGLEIHTDVQSTVLAGDIVLLNLPTFYAVKEVVFGDQGVAKVIRPPQCIVD